jgi:hypothetical protein
MLQELQVVSVAAPQAATWYFPLAQVVQAEQTVSIPAYAPQAATWNFPAAQVEQVAQTVLVVAPQAVC